MDFSQARKRDCCEFVDSSVLPWHKMRLNWPLNVLMLWLKKKNRSTMTIKVSNKYKSHMCRRISFRFCGFLIVKIRKRHFCVFSIKICVEASFSLHFCEYKKREILLWFHYLMLIKLSINYGSVWSIKINWSKFFTPRKAIKCRGNIFDMPSHIRLH